jgi:hypothetical protein
LTHKSGALADSADTNASIRCIVASGIFRVSLYTPADVIGDVPNNFFAFQLDYEEIVARS